MSVTRSTELTVGRRASYVRWSPYFLLTLGLTVLLVMRPQSPDLIAQLARVAASHATNGGTWWTSWYGGISTRSYSLISPALMSIVGAWTVGATSVVVTVGATSVIVGSRQYARVTEVLVAAGMLANLSSGRITFGLGVAAAALSVLLVRKQFGVAAGAAAVISFAASPLSGFFLGLILVPLLWQSPYRRAAWSCCVSLAITVFVAQILFPSTGYEPISFWQGALMAVGCGLVLSLRPSRYLKVMAIVLFVVTTSCLFVASPIGSNILRLPLVFAPAVVLLESRRSKRFVLPVVAFFLCWLIVISGIDLFASQDPSATRAFYSPLLQHLPAAGTAANRVEVVDPATHGPALYVAPTVPLARGWERQIDASQNGLFYGSTLSGSQYRQWLDRYAVRWVAVPNSQLDYASVTEAQLIVKGLPYLTRVWRNSNWTLYEVNNYTSVASAPVTAIEVKPDAIQFSARSQGWSEFRVVWVRSMHLVNASGVTVGEVVKSGNNVDAYIPANGTYSLLVS